MRFSGALRRSGLLASLVAAFMFSGVGISAADYGTQSYSQSCFGNWGTFRDNSRVLEIDWPDGPPECFGVAPAGTIWHTWQGASAWHEMPGNGRAVDIEALIAWGPGVRNRTVTVRASSGDYWCQDYFPGSGWVGSWYHC